VQGFLTASSQRAKTFFDKASTCFQDAVDQVCLPTLSLLGAFAICCRAGMLMHRRYG